MDLVSKGVLYIPNIQATPGNNLDAEWLRSKIPIFYQWYQDVYGAVIDKNVCYYGAHKIFDFPVIYEGVKTLNYEQLGATPLEAITTKALTHTCGAKIEYQISSIADKNVPLACPYDNLSLGVSGIKETVIITNLDAMAAKLQGEIAALDNRIAELLGQIEALSDEMARTKEILGV